MKKIFLAIVFLSTLSLFLKITTKPSKAIPQHRIGVRVINGVGEFYDKLTSTKFIPRGNNYIRIAEQDDPWSGRVRYHAVFIPGLYNPIKVEAALNKMRSDGYNIVRVFINDLAIGEESGGLSQAYLANVVDFLKKAKSQKIYTILTFPAVPRRGGYTVGNYCNNIDYGNWFYLCQGGIDAKKKYLKDFINGLISLDAPLDYIFSYNIENEAHFIETDKPLSLSSGLITTANGQTYNMATEKQQMMDANLNYWINEVRKAILEVDPTALVAPGFFNPLAVEGSDPRIIRTYWAIADPEVGGSQADYIDLHAYPGFRSWGTELAGFEISSQKKPLVMGEFGAFKSKYPILYNAAIALMDWQVQSCQSGFDGWLLWTWDTNGGSDIWDALSDEGAINGVLAPILRYDPCRTENTSPPPTPTPPPFLSLSLGWNQIVWPNITGKKASDIPPECPIAVAKEDFWFKPYVRNFGGVNFNFENRKSYHLKCSQETVWNL